jgi:hypothetical protein
MYACTVHVLYCFSVTWKESFVFFAKNALRPERVLSNMKCGMLTVGQFSALDSSL